MGNMTGSYSMSLALRTVDSSLMLRSMTGLPRTPSFDHLCNDCTGPGQMDIVIAGRSSQLENR